MIIVRVGLGLGNKHIITTTMPTTGPISASSRSAVAASARVDSESLYPMNPVKVNVVTCVDHKVDGESDFGIPRLGEAKD